MDELAKYERAMREQAEAFATMPHQWWNRASPKLMHCEVQLAIAQAYGRGREDELEEWAGCAPEDPREQPKAPPPPAPAPKREVRKPPSDLDRPGDPPPDAAGAPGPVEYVRRFIAANPGKRSKDIADACAKYSGAKNQRMAIYTIVTKLIDDGAVESDEKKGRWIKGSMPVREVEDVPAHEKPAQPPAPPHDEQSGKAAIVEYVEQHPGAKTPEITKATAPAFQHRALPRHAAGGHLNHLVRNGVLEREPTGGVRVVKVENTPLMDKPPTAYLPMLAQTKRAVYRCPECKREWGRDTHRRETGCRCDCSSVPID